MLLGYLLNFMQNGYISIRKVIFFTYLIDARWTILIQDYVQKG